MNTETKELQKLKGIGEVLAQRLIDAGFDTVAKMAAADEAVLSNIKGFNPKQIAAVKTQAEDLVKNEEKSDTDKVDKLRQLAASLKEEVQNIAISIRDRFQDEIVGKAGKKLEKELIKVITSLEKVEGKLETKVKKAGKGLIKAERRLEGIVDSRLKGVCKGLKKARKSLEKVYS